MVSCPACGLPLPYGCRCYKAREERLDAYLRQMARELLGMSPLPSLGEREFAGRARARA
jgi:hypothetical protein